MNLYPMFRKAGASLVIALVVFLGGCSPSGPRMVPVSGVITFNGAPIPEGSIVFEPLDENTAGSNAVIKNGEFASQASSGKTIIRILAFRAGGAVDSTMGMAPKKQYLPPECNSQSKHELDIAPSGSTGLKIELTGTEVP